MYYLSPNHNYRTYRIQSTGFVATTTTNSYMNNPNFCCCKKSYDQSNRMVVSVRNLFNIYFVVVDVLFSDTAIANKLVILS